MDFLPPLVQELRGRATQLLATYAEAGTAAEALAVKSDVAASKVERRLAVMSSVGKATLIGVAGAAAVVGVASLKMASDFQSHMTLLQTAAGESSTNMKVVSNGILNMAGATGTGLTQLSNGMYIVEKAGIRGADGLKVLKAAAEGAKAENVDLATATNALTSVMMSYHLKAKDAVSVENELVAGSGMAKTTMQEYAGSLSSVIPVASAAGVSFAQVGGAIATLTQHGTSAQESTQELANTIRNLQAPSQVSQKAMQQLGLNVTDVSTKLGSRGLTGTIDVITNAITSKMGPSGLVFVDAMKKSQSASQDMQTMLTKMPSSLADLSQKFMSGQIGMKEYQKDFKNLGGSGYAMGAQFLALSKQTQGFNSLLTSGQPGAQTFSKYLKDIMGGATGMNTALMLGGENMGYFKAATDKVSEAAKKGGSNISTWAQTQATFKVQMAEAAQGIAAMGVRIGTVLIPIVLQAMKVAQQWGNYLNDNRGVLYALLGVMGGVAAIFVTAYVAQKAWNAALAVAKVVTVGYNVVAGIMGVVTKASTAASYGQAGATYASGAAQKAYAIGAGIARLATLASAAATNLAVEAQKGFQVVMWLMQGTQLRYFASLVATKVAMLAGAAATGVVTAAQWAWNAAMTADPVVLVVLAIVALIAIVILLVTHWKEVTAFLGAAWKNVCSFIQTVGNAVGKWWSGLWSGIVNFAVNVFKGYVSWVFSVWSGVYNFFRSIGAGISNWWSGLWNGIVNWGVNVFKGYISWVSSVWSGVYNFMRSIGSNISNWWSGFWNSLGSMVQGAFTGVVDFVRGIFNGVIDIINGVIGAINHVLGAGKAIGINVQLGTLPHFDVGTARVPGPDGAPLPAVVHGGEAIASVAALQGRKPMPSTITDAVHAQDARAGGSTAAPTVVTSGPTVHMTVQTGASPKRIASELGWVLKQAG